MFPFFQRSTRVASEEPSKTQQVSHQSIQLTMNTLLAFNLGGGDLVSLLVTFLVIIVVIAVIAGLIYAIETWVVGSAIPTPIKLVIGLVLIVLVIIWAIKAIGLGG